MSIEHDSSSRLHSRGSNERIVSAIVDPVQCRVLLESNEVDDGRAKTGQSIGLTVVPW